MFLQLYNNSENIIMAGSLGKIYNNEILFWPAYAGFCSLQ